VDWWNTLHQTASIIRPGGPTIDKSFLWPLLTMMSPTRCYSPGCGCIAMQTEILERRARALDDGKGRLTHGDFFAMGGYAVFVWPLTPSRAGAGGGDCGFLVKPCAGTPEAWRQVEKKKRRDRREPDVKRLFFLVPV